MEFKIIRPFLFWLLTLTLFFSASFLLAQTGEQIEIIIEGEIPIYIRADKIEGDTSAYKATFVGNVSISRQNETIKADRALWDNLTKSAELSGNIELQTEDFVAHAQRMVVNLELQLAKIYEGRAFFPARNYYFTGDLIEREGENTIYIKNGVASTCDGPNPAWSIHADNLTVTKGGFAKASGVRFDTKYVPAFYSPYLLFPVNNERQTGFLLPRFSNSSRDGVILGLPFFGATGENHDLTFIPIWRSKRGMSYTLEGRYKTQLGEGVWLGSYLSDKKELEYEYKTDSSTDKAVDRYWLRAQNTWQVEDWNLNLDLDIVSDPYYLHEFKDDLDGFFYSNSLFAENFGRQANESLDSFRLNTLYAQKNTNNSYYKASFKYLDNLYSHNNVDTLQNFASIQYNLVNVPLEFGVLNNLENKVIFALDMDYNYFNRKTNNFSETDESGHRVNIVPELFWSKDFFNKLNLNLNSNLGFSFYAPDGYRPSPLGLGDPKAKHSEWDSRITGEFNLALSTNLNRVYNYNFGKATALQHQITPTVSFDYLEGPNQDDLPYWDFIDRKPNKRTVRYGLLNTIVTKTPVYNEDKALMSHDYRQVLKFGIWSSYNMADNSKWDNKWSRYYLDRYYEKGSGPLELDLEVYLNSYLSARLFSELDTRTGDFVGHDISVKAQNKRGDWINVIYDFQSVPKYLGVSNDKHEEVRTDLNLVLNSDWSTSFSTRYDLDKSKGLENYLTLKYEAQCYGLGLVFSKREEDKRIGIFFDFLGLGSIE